MACDGKDGGSAVVGKFGGRWTRMREVQQACGMSENEAGVALRHLAGKRRLDGDWHFNSLFYVKRADEQ